MSACSSPCCCFSPAAPHRRPPPNSRLTEFAIVGAGGLSTTEHVITATNHGELPHTLVITDVEGDVVAATPLVPPGDTVTLDLELEEGRYSFTCRIVAEIDSGEIVDHFEAGMSTTVFVES